MRIVPAALLACAVAPASLAQCDPTWQTDIGNPGLFDGYAEAATPFDDGSGETLYVGGSFTRIGGINMKALARWNPDTNSYSKVGTGLSTGNTNGFVTSILPWTDPTHGTRLYVAGFFANAGGVSGTQSIGAWNGSSWAAIGTTFVSPESVWALGAYDLGDDEKLYLAGGFPQVGGLPASGVASYDGNTTTPVGQGLGMSGFSPFVSDMLAWDDGSGIALYVCGRFDSIDGVNARIAARYSLASGWQPIGNGLTPVDAVTTLDALCLFDDGAGEALYAAGSPFRPTGQSGNVSVCKWNGTAWSKVGQNVGGRVTDLHVWNDGSGPALYLSGTATPGINYFARLENNQWVPYLNGVGGGIGGNFPSVFGLRPYHDALVVAGNFTETGDAQLSSGLAILRPCEDPCIPDWNHDGTVNTIDVVAFLNAFNAGC